MKETKYWTWHIFAAVVILVFLGLHMVVMHMDEVLRICNPADGAAIDWGNVVARGKMIFFTVTYIILLGAALYHGLYGFQTILFEMISGKGTRKLLSVLLLLTGLALFALGTWAAVAARGVAMGA